MSSRGLEILSETECRALLATASVGPGVGWSVLVVGYAEEIRDTRTLERVDQLALEPWVDEHDHFVVRIKARRITGRRILRGRGHE